MWRRYAAYLRQPPELSLAWTDPETGARGWLIVNSLRGGAAGGGTRMRAGLGEPEVTYLAKAMELKFALTGPPIGGAKSGIDFDPHDVRKPEVLERWYRAIEPELRLRYGTAGDLNVDELLEVTPAIRRLGLRHPQEGVLRGNLGLEGQAFEAAVARLDRGATASLNGQRGVAGVELTVADTITGYGVAQAVRHYYGRRNASLAGVRVLIEGFGNVGASCALYLARSGAHIVGITDAEQTLVDIGGLDPSDVETLVHDSRDRLLPRGDHRVVRGVGGRTAFWATPADVFVCAALSDSLDLATLDRLQHNGVEVIACGANHPFHERRMGTTRVQRLADHRFAIIADVLANCGRARAFAYLMEPGARPAEDAIFEAVRDTIENAMDETLERAGNLRRDLLDATLDMLLDRVGAP
jgi:glutamate dehydrogenase/leucine dehydrogenase